MKDREYITRPDQWLHWPRLPVKRPGSPFVQLGVLMETDPFDISNTKYIVFPGANLWKVIPPDAERITYETVDAVLADGWEVD